MSIKFHHRRIFGMKLNTFFQGFMLVTTLNKSLGKENYMIFKCFFIIVNVLKKTNTAEQFK